jgi:hypothetical protein
MPTISKFYGILVAILFEDNDRHSPHSRSLFGQQGVRGH